MSGRFLLDTNIVIALFANDPLVKQQFQNTVEIIVPSIVLGELYFGAQKSGQKEKILNSYVNLLMKALFFIVMNQQPGIMVKLRSS